MGIDTVKSIIRFPLIRIILFLGMLGLMGYLVTTMVKIGTDFLCPRNLEVASVSFALVLIIVFHYTYLVLVRALENRRAEELSPRGALPELASGVGGGFALITVVMLAIWAGGYLRISTLNSPSVMLNALAISVGSAYADEIVCRGVIFRILHEWLGPWVALLLSSFILGGLHLGNPHATLLSAFAMTVEAGLLLSAVYLYSGRLWMAIGFHSGWNFCEYGIFGVPVSGVPLDGLMQSSLSGPPWLSGGSFGPEASLMSVLASTSMAGFFLWKYLRKRQASAQELGKKRDSLP